MKILIPLAVLSILLAACNKKVEDKKADITYVMTNFRVESAGGCQSDTLRCASYEVNYPEFSGLDSAVERILRRHIEATVSMGNPEVEGKSMKEIGEGFIAEYDDFLKEMPDASGGWYYSADAKAETVTDTLISLSVHNEYYTGGAHGGADTYFVNIHPKTGAAFTLDNLLKVGYQEPLTKLGEEEFRRVREMPDTASLNENYFEFPDDKFQLNQNYGFKKEGIVFFYNSYEIAPYAAGPTEIVIPFEKVREWIKNQ
jgi:hypothetical protein